jgi:hypothetical protein
MEDGIVAHRMAAASAAEAGAALLGRPGTAWRLTTTKGSYLVATESGDRKGCAVVGDVADDSGVRAAFDLLVSSFIAGHDLGTPDKLPVQNGQVHGEPAALQLIGVTPGRLAKQAFVNMATGKGPVMHVRLTREFGPPGG